MLIAALVTLALLALCVGVVFWLVRRSPEGHEDGRGFTYGSPENPAEPPPRENAKAAPADSFKAPAV